MSYESESVLPASTRVSRVQEILELLGYYRLGRTEFSLPNEVASYYWFEEKDYRSSTGIELSIYKEDSGELTVTTRTSAGRSYWDLYQQNRTIQSLKRQFGGNFATDAGRNRYWHVDGQPPVPAQSGCYLAFHRFGHNLIRASMYLDQRSFPNEQWQRTGKLRFVDEMNPRLLSNNLLLPFFVSVLEDYFKSTFVALLQYSERKEVFFKNARLTSEQLVAVSSGRATIESALAEVLPFQNISSICQHFKSLEPNLDLAGELRKPYRRRKETLFESLDQMVKRRHAFIHRGQTDVQLEDADVMKILDDLEIAIERCYRRITSFYNWPFTKGWGRGRRPRIKRQVAASNELQEQGEEKTATEDSEP